MTESAFDDDAIDRGAEALCARVASRLVWGDMTQGHRDLYRDDVRAVLAAVSAVHPAADSEHLIFDMMRRYPDGAVRVYGEDGKLIAGTWCYQATNDLDRLHAALAAASRERDELRVELDACRRAQARAVVRWSQDETVVRLFEAERERDDALARLAGVREAVERIAVALQVVGSSLSNEAARDLLAILAELDAARPVPADRPDEPSEALEWESHPLPPNLGCAVPPPGWWCSREPGHEGPCAARPQRDEPGEATR